LIQELRGFRPKVEKNVGNAISVEAMNTMKKAKLDAGTSFSMQEPESEQCFEVARDSFPNQVRPEANVQAKRAVIDRPRMSKRRRVKLASDGKVSTSEFDGWDVQIDGIQVKNSRGPSGAVASKAKTPVEQFVLSTKRDASAEAKERGLDMDKYQLDLMPDDSTDIKRHKSVVRWDAKKKKYLPVMVAGDGRVLKKTHKNNESGVRVTGEGAKTNIYKKWTQASKRRIQKVGELEQGPAKPIGKSLPHDKTIEFGNDLSVVGGEGGMKKRKPVVPFHGEIDPKFLTAKQKRLLKKRERGDRFVQGDSKPEVKTAQEMQKWKKGQHENKVKQSTQLRKEKAKKVKDSRKRLHEERQMKYGARTRAKMLIFEGTKQWKQKQRTPKGYARASN